MGTFQIEFRNHDRMAAGRELGPYELLSPIGAGMGEVWKAGDTRLDGIVAIEHLKHEHIERFKREARGSAFQRHHPLRPKTGEQPHHPPKERSSSSTSAWRSRKSRVHGAMPSQL